MRLKFFLHFNTSPFQFPVKIDLATTSLTMLAKHHMGGFQLEFVSISLVINHMTCYKFECSHWWKIYFIKNPLQDLLSSLNAVISTNESTRIITGHVIYNPAYTYSQVSIKQAGYIKRAGWNFFEK